MTLSGSLSITFITGDYKKVDKGNLSLFSRICIIPQWIYGGIGLYGFTLNRVKSTNVYCIYSKCDCLCISGCLSHTLILYNYCAAVIAIYTLLSQY